MSSHRAAVAAWSIGLTGALLGAGVAPALALLTPVPTPPELGYNTLTAAWSVGFSALGALIVARRRHRIGWLFLAAGVGAGVNSGVQAWAAYGLPAAGWAAWTSNWEWAPGIATPMALILLEYPTGELPSRRWRPVLAGLLGACAVVVIATVLRPGPLVDEAYSSYVNPLGVIGPVGRIATAANNVGGALLPGMVLLCALAPILRWPRSSTVERKQLKWLAATVIATAVAGAAAVIVASASGSSLVRNLPLILVSALPFTTGIAILRYRLFDIDRIVSRTISYAILSAVLAGVYAALALVLGAFVPGSSVVVAASTLAVAAVFAPARRSVQSVVDRRFNRTRYDAAREAEAFAERLRESVDLVELHADLRAVARGTVQPERVSVWLRNETRTDTGYNRRQVTGKKGAT